MNNKNLKKKRLKLNPDIFLLAAESYFRDDSLDSLSAKILAGAGCTSFSCIRIKVANSILTGGERWVNPIERTVYENLFRCANRTFYDMVSQLDGYAYRYSDCVDNTRVMALCLAAELARQHNNKKGGLNWALTDHN